MHWVKLTISWSPWLIAWAVLAAVVGRDEQPTARSVRPSSAAASAPAAGHRRVVPLAFVVFMFRSLLTAGHSPAWGKESGRTVTRASHASGRGEQPGQRKLLVTARRGAAAAGC